MAPPVCRLLVFGINYAPEPTGIALNTTWLAESLAALGWEVTVVTGRPHYPSWRAGAAPRRAQVNGVSIIRRRHYVPPRQSVLRRGLYEATWVLSALPTLLRRRRVDLALGVVPSLGGAVLAAAAAVRYRVPYVVLFQDLVGRAAEQSGIAGGRRVAGPVQVVEHALARRALRVAIVAEGYQDYLESGGVDPERIVPVQNPARLGPTTETRTEARGRLGWPEGLFVVLHAGSMGLKQGLENVVQAAALARDDPGILFVLQGDGNQRRSLETMSQELGLANLAFLPLASDGEFAGNLAAADALLLNQRASVENMSMPAKLASYFAAGVPVVAAVSADDETAREVDRAGAGIVVEPDRPDLLLEAVRGLREDPGRATWLGAAGKDFAERCLSEETVLAGFVQALVSTPSRDGLPALRAGAAG